MDGTAAAEPGFFAKLSGAARGGRAAARGPRRHRGGRVVDADLRGDWRGVLTGVFRRTVVRRPIARRGPAGRQELPAVLCTAQTETTRWRGETRRGELEIGVGVYPLGRPDAQAAAAVATGERSQAAHALGQWRHDHARLAAIVLRR